MQDGRFLIERISGVPVVATPEEIDMANAAELESALLAAAANGPRAIVADLTLTRFCDSRGIRALLGAHQRAQSGGGELLLVVPDAAVRRVFAIIGLDRAIPHFTSLDAALTQVAPAHSQAGLNPGYLGSEQALSTEQVPPVVIP